MREGKREGILGEREKPRNIGEMSEERGKEEVGGGGGQYWRRGK